MTAIDSPAHAPSRRRGAYGIDAPYVPALMLGAAALAVAAGAVSGQWLMWTPAIVIFGVCGVLYLYTTLRGKFLVWRDIADGLGLRGDEEVLDVGCGRGMVTTTIAARLSSGHVTGIDIWSSHDQSGNAMAVTQENAELEGVADRVQLRTADMRDLPFDDATFDVVVTNAAIHNLKHADDRAASLAEVWRVTKPGGRLVLADIHHTAQYGKVLTALGATDVRHRSAGWRGWFGNPAYATRIVEATR